MGARNLALKIYPIAAGVAAGALVYIWITNPRKK